LAVGHAEGEEIKDRLIPFQPDRDARGDAPFR
jgi:hypothetical protein